MRDWLLILGIAVCLTTIITVVSHLFSFPNEWWPIAGFLIFLTGIVTVAVQAIRHVYKDDDKSSKSTRP